MRMKTLAQLNAAGAQKGQRTRLFTKQEYRISRGGAQLPQGQQHTRQRKVGGARAPPKSSVTTRKRPGGPLDAWLPWRESGANLGL